MLAIPSFIAGVFAIFIFSFELQWFPFQGSVDINLKEGTFEYYMSKIYHTFLPAFTLGLLGNLISDITYGFIDPRIRSN